VVKVFVTILEVHACLGLSELLVVWQVLTHALFFVGGVLEVCEFTHWSLVGLEDRLSKVRCLFRLHGLDRLIWEDFAADGLVPTRVVLV